MCLPLELVEVFSLSLSLAQNEFSSKVLYISLSLFHFFWVRIWHFRIWALTLQMLSMEIYDRNKVLQNRVLIFAGQFMCARKKKIALNKNFILFLFIRLSCKSLRAFSLARDTVEKYEQTRWIYEYNDDNLQPLQPVKCLQIFILRRKKHLFCTDERTRKRNFASLAFY